MDSLATTSDCRAFRNALGMLPTEVNSIYADAMGRISAYDLQLAKRVLMWITYTHRPLSLTELQHAVAICDDMTDMDLEAIVHEQILTTVCAGLVVIEQNSGIVRLVRESFSFWI